MQLKIKEATYDDIQGVHQYMSTIFDMKLNGLSIRPTGFKIEEAKHYLPENKASKEKLCALAIYNNLIVGQLAFTRYTKPEYRHGGRFGMSVHPDHWRKGIGASLLAYFENWARERGVRKIELEVWSNNFGAMNLYEKNGYLYEGRRKGSIITNNHTIDLILMGKNIG